MKNFATFAPAVVAGLMISAPALGFCLLGCEPKAAEAQKVFENVVRKKFDPDAKIENFEVTRFWRIDVEGAENKSVEFYFTSKVAFPKGANLDCKPVEGVAPKPGCSADVSYFSTTIQNKMVKDRQYIEPGKVIEFKDETRFDHVDGGWKGQDGVVYTPS